MPPEQLGQASWSVELMVSQLLAYHIHGNNFESNLAVLLSPVNSKKYIHLRDTIFFDKKRSLLRKLIKTLFKWQSNKYFCISEYIKKQYIKIRINKYKNIF